MGNVNARFGPPRSPFEQDPRYALAMLKTSFELRDKSDPKFEEIFSYLLKNSEFSSESFHVFLRQYRDDLRKNCRKKGLI